MSTLSARESRTVNRERTLRRITTFERVHGTKLRRPARTNLRRAAITASTLGL